MNNIVCPSDEELMPILAGETSDESMISHLDDCPVCRHRMDLFRSDLSALRSASFHLPTSPPSPPRPSRIGKYLIVGTLDSGGQADVYRAVHPTLETELAIKLSKRPVGRLSDHRALLVAEGKLLAKLEHPGLARIFDLDFHDDLPFLAMEFVRGSNLRKHATEVRLSPRESARILVEVSRAVAEVHRHGVVRKDYIKPHNILIDEAGRPRLIDFGMARLRHAWDDSGERTSGGTPAFMAPEQARNEEAAVGPRSDVFALGGVLYFLLTGSAPFDGETVLDSLKRAGKCDFDRSALDRPTVPRRLRDICLKAMAPAPADRYPRAGDFADDLERYLDRPARARRLAGVGLAVAALVGLGIVFWPPKPVSQDPLKTQPSSVSAPQVPLEVTVTRGAHGEITLPLAAALPIRAAEDRVRIEGRVPPGHEALLLWVSANGKVVKLDIRKSPANGYTRLIYPAQEGVLADFSKEGPGTEVILLFAAANKDALKEEDIINLVKQYLTGTMRGPDDTLALRGLPVLPPTKTVWLDPDEARPGTRPFGPGRADETTQVQDQLDQLRQRLRVKPLSVIRGVAYAR